MRAFCDNFAAVRLEGLYAPVEAPGAEPLADYIYVVKHTENDKGAVEVPWADWGFSEGPDFEQWVERLGPPSDAQYGRARMARELDR